jgi:multiple sugar transport system ATP-binding protein
MSSIEYQHVSKQYGRVTVLEDISLSIDDGELVVFVGPSGCGKSTLLRLLAGLEDFTSGDIRIAGQSVLGLPPRGRNVAMVFQSYALYPHMTVAQNIGFALKLRKMPKKDIDEAVNRVALILGLDTLLNRKPRQLSGGQRQRVAMGRAIVRDPQVFLMDEPLSNLDAKLRNQMRVEIKQLQRRLNTTMIYVTHDQVEAMTLADRIVILDGGRIRQVGTPEDVYHRPTDPFVADFIGSPAMNLLSAHRQGEGRLVLGNDVSFPFPAGAQKGVKGQEFTVGIRPEHVMFDPDPSMVPQGAVLWKTQVNLLESLGGECLVHLDMAGQDLRLKVPGTAPCMRGDRVCIGFAPESLHLFSGEEGTCLLHGLGPFQ